MNKVAETVSDNRINGKDRKKQILRVAQHVFAEDNCRGAIKSNKFGEIEKRK
jgi:hypothetical protein